MKSSEIDEEPLLPHVDVECAQCSLYSTQCVHVAHTRHMHARQPAVLCMRGCALRIYIYIRILWPYLVSVPMYVSELARACQRHRSVSLARCFARLELEPVRSTQTNVDSYTTAAAAATRCPCIGDV